MSKRITRRLLAAAFCVLMTAASCLPAFAAGNTITIKECDGMQITLPDYMSAVTRSSKEDDPYFVQHGTTYEDVQESFRVGNNYLQAMDYDNMLTLTVSYLDTGTKDFNTMTEEELSELQRVFLGGTDPNVQYTDSTADEPGNELVWLFLDMTLNEGTGRFQFQSTTVSSGKNITLTLYRNDGDVQPTDYAVLESITRSVTPPHVPWFKRILPFLMIVLGAAALIVLIFLIVKLVKRYKETHLDAKSKNDKILEELKGKYANSKHLRTAKDGEDGKKSRQVFDESEEYVDIYANSTPDKAAAKPAPAPEKTEAPAPEKAEAPAPEKAEAPAPAPEKTEAPAPAPQKAEAPKPAPAAEPKPAPAKAVTSYLDDDDDDYAYDGDEPQRKYSDEDIERLLAD